MQSSYHNHTRWSDGGDTAARYARAASELGLGELGISDHYALRPSGERPAWSMAADHLMGYASYIRSTARSSQVPLRLGLEADYFPETVLQLRAQLDAVSPDYVIGAVHFVGDFPIDRSARDWAALSVDAQNETWREYWRLVECMAASEAFDIVAHLDLPKKFGYRPTVDLRDEARRALDAIAASDMAIELNTNGWDAPTNEPYPSWELLQEARARAIPLIITADAHSVTALTRHFPAALTLARAAGYTHLARYRARTRTAAPLDSSAAT